jgi:hypothetical protein
MNRNAEEAASVTADPRQRRSILKYVPVLVALPSTDELNP